MCCQPRLLQFFECRTVLIPGQSHRRAASPLTTQLWTPIPSQSSSSSPASSRTDHVSSVTSASAPLRLRHLSFKYLQPRGRAAAQVLYGAGRCRCLLHRWAATRHVHAVARHVHTLGTLQAQRPSQLMTPRHKLQSPQRRCVSDQRFRRNLICIALINRLS